MKSSNILVLGFLSLSLISCGRDAEIIKVDSSLLPTPKIASLLGSEQNVEKEMRTASIVLYPNSEELSGFSYDFTKNNNAETVGWSQVISKLSYGKKLPKEIGSDEANFDKVIKITRYILSMSEARDNFYKEAGLFQKDLDVRQKEMENLTKTTVAAFPCFYQQETDAGTTCELKAHEGDSTPPVAFADNCKTLQNWKFTFANAGDEQSFNDSVVKCIKKSNENRNYRREVKQNKIVPLLDLRKAAKGVVTDMLKSAEVFNNQRYLLTAATIEDPANDETKSVIEFSQDKNVLEKFELYMDAGNGFKMYTVQNGGLQNVSWKKDKDGVQVLSFLLIDSAFTIQADLAASVQDVFDLRLVGDITYREGSITRKGVMKLEWNLLK